jgi:DNA-binding NtrC family response regulator
MLIDGVAMQPKTTRITRGRPRPIIPGLTALVPLAAGLKANFEALEKALIERALRQAKGNKTRAAEVLGVHRGLLYEKLREYGLESE